MNNKELQIKAEKYIEENDIDKNTYAIEKAFRDGAKMILNLGQELPIHNVSKRFLFKYRSTGKELVVKLIAKNLKEAMKEFIENYHEIEEIYSVVEL